MKINLWCKVKYNITGLTDDEILFTTAPVTLLNMWLDEKNNVFQAAFSISVGKTELESAIFH